MIVGISHSCKVHFNLHWIYAAACGLYKRHSRLSNQRYRRERPSINNDNFVYRQNVLFVSDRTAIPLSSSLLFLWNDACLAKIDFSRELIVSPVVGNCISDTIRKRHHICWHRRITEIYRRYQCYVFDSVVRAKIGFLNVELCASKQMWRR